ncbi:MAG: MATE family efflux transporter [Clostridia bacterium]|nr:MATE family efflux transporter [Clostridia bacterium]
MSFFRKYIGDKAFYRMVLGIAVPIMLQNGVTSFVNMLDNLMVGSLGTEAMSGVSIVNQFIFVFNLLIFGAVSAAGIFTAQYYGSKNTEGVRHTFRFKLLVNALAVLLGVGAFLLFGDDLIRLFLHQGDGEGDLALTFSYAKDYLVIMLIGFVPYALSQVYASTMRETGEPVWPLIAGVVAVATNGALNAVFIFALGLGVKGAAIATVVSRFAEALLLMAWSHRHVDRCSYLKGAYTSLYIPRTLVKRIVLGGLPLMANELLWSLAITVRSQCYSTRGLDVVAAMNISNTVYNVFSVIYLAMGSAIAIIIGNLLGAGKTELAKETDCKLIAFSVFCGACTGVLILLVAPAFPLLYETSATVQSLATYLMVIQALVIPFDAFTNAAYFTIRSGGQILVTMLSDSVFMWVVVVPVCCLLAYLTPLSIFALFAICHGCDCLKALFGCVLLRRDTWARRLVSEDENAQICQ